MIERVEDFGQVTSAEPTQLQPKVEHQTGIRWQDVLLNPDINSEAYRRLSGVLNILKSGAQTLTVLSMVDDPNSFVNTADIRAQVQEKVGSRTIKKAENVKTYLTRCIEPVGAAARSTLDDEMWALTPFGIEMKASLILAWSKFLEAGIDPMDVLATASHSKKDDEGHITSTPAVARATILTALNELGKLNVSRLKQILKMEGGVVANHLINLEKVGLVNYESVECMLGKPIVHFTLTEKGRNTGIENWPFRVDSRGNRLVFQTELVRKAIEELSVKGRDINLWSISEIILLKYPDYKANGLRANIASLLSFWEIEDRHLLNKSRFKQDIRSEASITGKGLIVVDGIFSRLAMWSIDPPLTPDIESIAKKLRINPDAYQDIYVSIAESFRRTSPFFEKNGEDTSAKVLGVILKKQGNVSTTDISRIIGISVSRVHQIVKELKSQGYLIGEKDPTHKSRIFLRTI